MWHRSALSRPERSFSRLIKSIYGFSPLVFPQFNSFPTGLLYVHMRWGVDFLLPLDQKIFLGMTDTSGDLNSKTLIFRFPCGESLRAGLFPVAI